MSAIAALCADGGPDRVPMIARMLAAAPELGADHQESWSDPQATLGVAWHDWEARAGIQQRGSLTLAADCTLVHDARGPAAILERWERAGEGALDELEGDFAFILWDAAREQLRAARDFVGKRGLFYAWHGGTLRVASTMAGVLADPRVPREIDLVRVAQVAAGLWSHGAGTAYRAVQELPAGHVLTWTPGSPPRVRPFWSPPERIVRRPGRMDDAVAELRHLIDQAVLARLSPAGPTAVSLSGGWDSTAVYASGRAALKRTGDDSRRMHAVSISYAEGDAGREDELITQVLEHWGDTPDFIDIATIPLFADAERGARQRDQPLAHAYEQWNRRLSRRARAIGARVILDGGGGDHLFQLTEVYLADLLRLGRLPTLIRQARQRSGGRITARALYRWAVRPLLPQLALRLIAAVRRTPVGGDYLDRDVPYWMRRSFLAEHDVVGSDRRARPSLPSGSAVVAETHAYLRFPFYPRVFALLHRFALDEGVEVRSPLLDARVVRFAAARPWYERVDGPETKILLRRAMHGLLPDAVLAPRPHRTGVTSSYFLREMRTAGWEIAQRVIPDARLATLGIIDPDAYRRAWEQILKHDHHELAARAFFTLQAELWLRAREP